jgi:hypothetical protein
MEIFCVFEEHIERNKSDKKNKKEFTDGFLGIYGLLISLKRHTLFFLSLFGLLNKNITKNILPC